MLKKRAKIRRNHLFLSLFPWSERERDGFFFLVKSSIIMLGFQKRIRLWYDKLWRENFKKLIFIPISFVIRKVYTLRVFFSRFNSSLIRKMSQPLRLLKCKPKYFLGYRRLSGVTKRWQVPSAAYEHYHLLECVSSAAGHNRFTLLLVGTWVVENLTTVSNFRVDCSEV